VRPDEQGKPGGPGDAFYWFSSVVPIIAAFFGSPSRLMGRQLHRL
jgi:hypothetical protein